MALGLTLLLLGLSLTALAAVSAKWWFGYSSDTWLADVADGTLYTKCSEPGGRPRGWYGGPNLNHDNGSHWIWTWWTLGAKDLPRERLNTVSIWPLGPIVTLAGGMLLLNARRRVLRAARQLCINCGYPRTGIASTDPCPECGEKINPPSPNNPPSLNAADARP